MTNFRFVLLRMRHYWQVLLALVVGIFLATALLASGPVLVDTVIAFGLRRTLLSAAPAAANVRVAELAAADGAVQEQLTEQLQALLEERLGDYLVDVIPAGGSRYLFPWVNGDILPEERVNFRFYDESVDALMSRATLSAGAWPTAADRDGDTIPVVAAAAMAEAYVLDVGDTLPLSLRNTDAEPTLTLRITGILAAANSQDPYWYGTLSPLRSQGDQRYSEQYGVLLSPADFLTVSAGRFPESEVSYAWHALLDPESIRPVDLPLILFQLEQIDRALADSPTGLRTETTLGETITRFEAQAAEVRSPLYFLTATIVLLALYFVIMASGLSLRQRQMELAVLRSRGASPWQLFQLQLQEALIICFVAVLSGPLLAWLFVRQLVAAGPLADVAQAAWTIPLPLTAWLAAVVGALACIVSLLGPVPLALRRTVVTAQQDRARSERPPLWQRFYLDVILLVIGLILIWRLRLTGSIIGGGEANAPVDWLLLLAPLALLLGAATILLRLFPVVLRFLGDTAGRRRGLPDVLALWQLARNPGQAARLVLLLTLATALGLFATGLNAALDRNETDASRYAAGSDLRIVSPGPTAIASVPALDAVSDVAPMLRGSGVLQQRIGNVNLSFEYVGIEPDSFGDAVAFRNDFATRPLPALLETLDVASPDPIPTLPLPGRPETMGLWLWIPDEYLDRLNLLDFDVKLVTAQGATVSVHLNMPEFDPDPQGNQHYFTGQLPPLPDDSFPLAVQSLWFRHRSSFFVPEIPLAIDDLTVQAPDGETVVVESFENEIGWQTIVDDLQVARRSYNPRSGSRALALSVAEDGTLRPWRWYGINLSGPPGETPLPALASASFLETTSLQVGDKIGTWLLGVPVTFDLVGVVDYFPTVYETEAAGYLITLHDPLLARFNITREVPSNSNELLLTAPDTLSIAELERSLPSLFTGRTQTVAADEVRRIIKADPLALGLRSVTLFGYILTAVLSLAGFGTNFYLSARERAASYGVLRALGLGPRQLLHTLLLEQTVLIVAGLTVGTGLGLLLNQLTLGELPLSLGEGPPVPPLLAQVDWQAMLGVYAVLTAAFLLLLAAASLMLWRTRLYNTLRVGDE